MATTDIWFPFYVGDHLADTLHLDTRAHGAYAFLLLAYYKARGPLPDDDRILATITRLSLANWRKLRPILAPFFEVRDGKWIQKRAEFEINRRITAQTGRVRGARTTNRRLGRTVTDTVTDTMTDTVSDSPATRSGVAIPQSQSEPEVNAHTNSRASRSPTLAEVKALALQIGTAEPEAENFWNHFEASGWVDKNGNRIHRWQSKLKTWTSSVRTLGTAKPRSGPGLPGPLSGADKMIKLRELEDVEGRIKSINGSYSDHQDWSAEDIAKSKRLKARRGELKKALGMET